MWDLKSCDALLGEAAIARQFTLLGAVLFGLLSSRLPRVISRMRGNVANPGLLPNMIGGKYEHHPCYFKAAIIKVPTYKRKM